jgi:hypothetical protein
MEEKKQKKALICAILTNENEHLAIGFIESLEKISIPNDVLIIDNRSKDRKFNDPIHKMTKRSNIKSLLKVNNNALEKETCYLQMLTHAKKYDYLYFQELDLVFKNADQISELIVDSGVYGCITPIIVGENGYVSKELYITNKEIFAIPLSGVPTEETISVPKSCFAMPGEILNKISLSFAFPPHMDKSLFLHYILASNGFKFKFANNFVMKV